MAAGHGAGARGGDLLAGEVVIQSVAWVPQIGLAAEFRVDGLSAFFATLILGIGLAITLYARYYLAPEDGAGRLKQLRRDSYLKNTQVASRKVGSSTAPDQSM